MPVPMVAPTPNIESWKSPMERVSSLLPGLAAGLVLHLDDGLAPEQLLSSAKTWLPPTVITWSP